MIAIAVGHNEWAKGATNGNIKEYDLAKKWVERIVEVLEHHVPVTVVPDVALRQKVEFINNISDVKFAVEMHFNANIPRARGSETLYFPGSKMGKELAEEVQRQFEIRRVFQPNRGAKEGWFQQNVSSGKLLYFLERTKCPSVIIEPEFLSNPEVIEQYFFEGTDAVIQALQTFYRKHYG